MIKVTEEGRWLRWDWVMPLLRCFKKSLVRTKQLQHIHDTDFTWNVKQVIKWREERKQFGFENREA